MEIVQAAARAGICTISPRYDIPDGYVLKFHAKKKRHV
jgi:hypothetical protein